MVCCEKNIAVSRYPRYVGYGNVYAITIISPVHLYGITYKAAA